MIEQYRKLFHYYKSLGQKTMDQLADSDLIWSPTEESNSIAIVVKHLHGNMLSRWTNFLKEDGEKPWRQRDQEFLGDLTDRISVQAAWKEGWGCLFSALAPLTDKDMERIVYIRNEGHTIAEAMNRQLAHYAYHVGQMVFLGKMKLGSGWQSLSIPRGFSSQYNQEKFAEEKKRGHFTDKV